MRRLETCTGRGFAPIGNLHGTRIYADRNRAQDADLRGSEPVHGTRICADRNRARGADLRGSEPCTGRGFAPIGNVHGTRIYADGQIDGTPIEPDRDTSTEKIGADLKKSTEIRIYWGRKSKRDADQRRSSDQREFTSDGTAQNGNVPRKIRPIRVRTESGRSASIRDS